MSLAQIPTSTRGTTVHSYHACIQVTKSRTKRATAESYQQPAPACLDRISTINMVIYSSLTDLLFYQDM